MVTPSTDHFLAVAARARFNLSISRRSEAVHLERTAPISDSFFRSMAASAAPSKSLQEEMKINESGMGGANLFDDVIAVLLPYGQVSFNLLFRCDLRDVLLGFIPVVVLYANLHKCLKNTCSKG